MQDFGGLCAYPSTEAGGPNQDAARAESAQSLPKGITRNPERACQVRLRRQSLSCCQSVFADGAGQSGLDLGPQRNRTGVIERQTPVGAPTAAQLSGPHFSAPARAPLTKYFCRNRYAIRIGSSPTRAAAAAAPKLLPWAEKKLAAAGARVRISGVVKM